MKKDLINFENKKIKDIEISDTIWGIKILPDIIHQYLRYQNAKSRQGSHKTKTRSEVNGRAKKPFSQKGTGNARQGSSKPPHFRGGATSMGPVNRDHTFSLNKKIENIVVNIGAANEILTTVANGKFLKAINIATKAINPKAHLKKCNPALLV